MGDVDSTIEYTKFNRNGNYCDPSLITLPDPDEAEDLPTSGDGSITEDELLAFKNNALDPMCVEIEYELHTGLNTVKEYEAGIDLDDGFDIDEAGEGGIVSNISHSEIKKNLDEGADFDEENDGGVVANFYYVNASLNTDDGIKITEEDDGNVEGTLMGIKANSNGGKAIVYEEEKDGDFEVNVFNSMTNGKNDGGDDGIEFLSELAGTCNYSVSDSMIKEENPIVEDGDCPFNAP
jgi:hypothetical protein